MTDQRTILRVDALIKVPGHSMYGDWALPDRNYSYVSLADLLPVLLPGKMTERVKLRDIWAKPGDAFGGNDFAGPRFEQADPKFPGLVVRDMPNPGNAKYRMIDGRRRLEKLRIEGVDSGLYYVFEYTEILPFIFEFELIAQS
ncbi:MAG: hypothetical protein O2971_19000 [Proteobacteria bacterium]|nr:hypothetical protein [Pseudomonadota bacterium]